MFGQETLRGELPPGWQAELYRGEDLLAFAQARPDGLFEFRDVPLLFGLNVFRVELYGPQGQRRSQQFLRNVGTAQTPPGSFYYRLSGNDPGASLLGEKTTTAGRRAAFELSAGLSPQISFEASLASVEIETGEAAYGQLGLRSFYGPLLTSADLAFDRDGGVAWQLRLHGRARALGVQLEHSELRDWHSETFPVPGGELRRRSWLRLDSVLPAGILRRLPVDFEVRSDERVDGRRLHQLGTRVSAFRKGLAVTHQLQWNIASGPANSAADETPERAGGQLLLNRLGSTLALRGELNYELAPAAELTTLALTAERRLRHDMLLTGGVSRAVRAGENRYLVGLSRLSGPLGVTATTEYLEGRGYRVSLLLSFGFGRDPRDGSWHSQARPLSRTGGLSALAFLDTNGNGQRDRNEDPVAGAGLRIGGADPGIRTNAEGTLFVANLPAHQAIDVELAESTLEDPYWRPARPGVSIVPRPGKVATLDFPVEIAGEITGTVYLQNAGHRREAGGVELELVGPLGEVVARTRSAADGFYDLPNLRPGRYAVRVAAAHVNRLGLLQFPSREVELLPAGSLIDNFNFVLITSD